MLYTKKELYKELEKIGSTNLREELLTNVINGKEQLKVVDEDRYYYWVLQAVSEDQYKIVAQGSMWL